MTHYAHWSCTACLLAGFDHEKAAGAQLRSVEKAIVTSLGL